MCRGSIGFDTTETLTLSVDDSKKTDKRLLEKGGEKLGKKETLLFHLSSNLLIQDLEAGLYTTTQSTLTSWAENTNTPHY